MKNTFSLSDVETLILGFCLAIELDSSFEPALKLVHQSHELNLPSLEFLRDILSDLAPEKVWVLSKESVLLKFQLVDIFEKPSLGRNSDKCLRINNRLLKYLMSDAAAGSLDVACTKFIELRGAKSISKLIDPSQVKKTQAFLGQKAILLEGSDSAHRQQFVKEVAISSNLNSILEIGAVRGADKNFHLWVFEVIREAALTNSLIYIKHDELNSKTEVLQFVEEVVSLGWPLIYEGENLENLDFTIKIKLQMESPALQKTKWQELLKLNLINDESEMLSQLHPMSCAKIESTFEKYLNEPRTTSGVLEYLLEGAAESVVFGAKRVKNNTHIRDMIFTPEKQKEFFNMIGHIQHRSSVLKDWGFSNQFKNRTGVNILFYGPSGTGKTCAANAMAMELKRTMYKVELSSLISKYVGETEKNIEKVFSELIKPSTLVFFDEAEALFAQRSEQKSSNDRFSNMEINYLLQKIEEHDGVVVLATNLERNIDPAFYRRFDYWIQFSLPTAVERKALWISSFPKPTPLGAIDFDTLAEKMEVTGANIRRIAFNAALDAKNENRVVEMSHIVRAAEAEHRKMGLFFNNSIEETLL